MNKTPEEILAEQAQEAEQKRPMLLRRGMVRIIPAADREVSEKQLRLLQEQELEYSRATA